MFGLNFGKSKSSSEQRSESTSSGFSLNQALSSSMSGGQSSGFSTGLSGSRGVTGSSSEVFSSDILRQLYGGAFGAAEAINPGLATERVNQLFTGGSSIIDKLTGGGAGEEYLTRRLAGDNSEVLNSQIDALGSDLGRFFNEQLNPAITGSAVAGGALGGGRQGVAQGMATSNILREFSTQAANLRAADITNRDNAALGLLERQGANAQTAIGGLGALGNLTQFGLTANLAPYEALSGIIGAPTVLASSFGETSSFGQEYSQQQATEFAQALSSELGISYDEAYSLMTAKSKGKSISGGISFGGGAG